jgi:hypothetical protein
MYIEPRYIGASASEDMPPEFRNSLLAAGNYLESVLGEQRIRVPVYVGIGNAASGVDQTAATTYFTREGDTVVFEAISNRRVRNANYGVISYLDTDAQVMDHNISLVHINRGRISSFAVSVHEIAHFLGMSERIRENRFYGPGTRVRRHVIDSYGSQGLEGQRLVHNQDAVYDAFRIARGDYPLFTGPEVMRILNGAILYEHGRPGLPMRRFDDSIDLSHIALMYNLLNQSNYRNRATLMAAEMAFFKDLGYGKYSY